MIKQGDVFAVCSRSPFAKIINAVSGWNSPDGESEYNHAGIITADNGQTFEALKTLDYYHLDQYRGRKILIARPRASSPMPALLKVILDHKGQTYPFWRLALFGWNPLARVISHKGQFTVCSELVAKYLFHLGVRHGQFTGTTPDRLADEWVKWRDFDIIFEGEWQ